MLNLVKNLVAIFTPVGLGVTFFLVLIICLITKKGYNWFSGYKFKRDPRGHALFMVGAKRLHINFEIPDYKMMYMGKAGGR